MASETATAELETAAPRKVKPVPAPGPAARCLDVQQVAVAIRSSRSEILKRVSERTFPRPFRFGRKNLWREATIIAWLERQEQKAQRS